MAPRAFLSFVILAAVALLAVTSPARAEEDAAKVEKIKSAYLLNFLRFTEWPPETFVDAESPFVITTVGRNALGEALEATMDGKVVDGRGVAVRRLQLPEPDARTGRVDEQKLHEFYQRLRASHLVFIDSSEQSRLKPILKGLDGASVLTVGDGFEFAQSGGMLGLVMRDNRIVFDANVDAIRRSPIRVSSKILKLATIVKSEGN
jgi:hypothetical protein